MDNKLLILIGLFILVTGIASFAPIGGSIIFGLIYTQMFFEMFGKYPLEYIGIHLNDAWFLLNLAVFPIIFYLIGSILSKNKAKKEAQEDASYHIDCPLQIIGFSSRNNLFTAGNNSVWFKVKNPSNMPYTFRVELKTNGKWKDSGYSSFDIGPKEIKEYDILGPAWSKSSDIRISSCV